MIVTAEDFAPGAEAGGGVIAAGTAPLRPDPQALFAQRAGRLRQVAPGHPMGAFLSFLGHLAEAQQGLVLGRTALPWQDALPDLLGAITALPGLPAAVGLATASLLAEDGASLEGRLARWLGGAPDPADLAGAPFVVAALQVERTLAAATATPLVEAPGRCPLCGGAPVASTIATRDGLAGVRLLHCGLCATAWPLERLRCGQCLTDGKVVSLRLEGLDGDYSAQTCERCVTYGKVLHIDRHPEWEVLADDLASLSLDLRLGEDGWRRLWPNPFLHAA